jgi:hypothetical protein
MDFQVIVFFVFLLLIAGPGAVLLFLRRVLRQIEKTRANLYCVQQTLDAVLKERESAEPEEHSRKDLVDEGFENIMRFSVNGRTGFEFSGKE